MSTPKRQNRTITVDFKDEATYHRLCQDGKSFIEFVVAFIVSLGFQLTHRGDCPGGFALTRHSHYSRVRLDNLTIWRLQCPHCRTVFTIMPHFALRYSSLPPMEAKRALHAMQGGLSLESCATVFEHISVMGLYRLVCALGRTGLVSLLTRCRLSLPKYLQADEKHSFCLTEKVYLPTMTQGRVIWHLGYSTDKSAASFKQIYGQFEQQAHQIEPHYQPVGILTDGFESTRKSLHELFPQTALGNCIRHAADRLASKLTGVTKELRETLCQEFRQILFEGGSLRTIGQKLRRFTEKVTKLTGEKNGQHLREWFKRKKEGWYTVWRDQQMPQYSTLLDQLHNTLDRKLFMMKGFHHPHGNQADFLTGLAMMFNITPYQRRAKNAGRCAIQVEGGILPSPDWLLSLQILSSGGLKLPPLN